MGNKSEDMIEILRKIKETSEDLIEKGEFTHPKELVEGYELFNQNFGPNKLMTLEGEALIDQIFNMKNKNSMVYWLEFKNDEEFKTNMRSYGSIAGGSSYKFIIFKREKDDKWVTGNPQNPTILNIDQAINLGTRIRDSLVLGSDLIKNLNENAEDKEYANLQQELDNNLIRNMSNLGWVHKYYHMIYPEKIDSFHSAKWKRHVLISLNIMPANEDELYTMSGQLMKIAKKTDIKTAHVMNAILEILGGPVSYYRIGTSANGKSYWKDMFENNYISIGWPKVGDLSIYDNEKSKTKIKANIVENLKEHYSNTPQVISKNANQIIAFYRNIAIGDIVVACNGEKILGIGRVSDEYRYLAGLDFPHIISVNWINVSNIELPKAKEGIRTTVYQYKDLDNILEIARMANIKTANGKRNGALPILSGIAKDIENVLERKKQVILYGPPGTGKTYHAEKICLELAARKSFNKSFESLSDSEKDRIIGDSRTNGLVRVCCFHPSYGYEDFIEGIKPRVIDKQTVFDIKDGIFKQLWADAQENPEENSYLLIDEINRGDISRIFGELIMLIESEKRGKSIVLPISSHEFKIAKNIYIVGTMNTADRSISLLDAALRRRFGFIELMPDYSLLEGAVFEGLPLEKWLKELNSSICEHMGSDGRNLQIGHSYFLENEKVIANNMKFKAIIKEDIIPLIEEYCYGDYTLMSKILGEGIVDSKKQRIRKELFISTEISDLTTALLAPYPLLGEDVKESEEEEGVFDIEDLDGEE